MYAYGPIPSRRLGRSIGVSPIPAKTCTDSCVYCQLGRTNHLQLQRESFFPKEDILRDMLILADPATADVITFVGDGEPTLNRDLGWLIHQIKQVSSLPVAVITNGALLQQPEVRNNLAEADIVLPSLDAGTDYLFRQINRPHGQLDFAKVVQGLIDFRKEYSGKLWLEVMLVKGLNDNERALKAIKEQADEVNPDRIYITTPIRPPAEKWVQPPTPDRILKAQKILRSAANISDLEQGEFGLDQFAGVQEAVREIATRHPLREEQARTIAQKFDQEQELLDMIRKGEFVRYQYGQTTYLIPREFAPQN